VKSQWKQSVRDNNELHNWTKMRMTGCAAKLRLTPPTTTDQSSDPEIMMMVSKVELFSVAAAPRRAAWLNVKQQRCWHNFVLTRRARATAASFSTLFNSFHLLVELDSVLRLFFFFHVTSNPFDNEIRCNESTQVKWLKTDYYHRGFILNKIISTWA